MRERIESKYVTKEIKTQGKSLLQIYILGGFLR